jgi:ABC-type transporter MlaC component
MENRMNDLTYYLLRKYGTRQEAADVIGLHNSALSVILNGYRQPTEEQREKFKAVLSKYHYKKFFGKPKAEKIEGKQVVNE